MVTNTKSKGIVRTKAYSAKSVNPDTLKLQLTPAQYVEHLENNKKRRIEYQRQKFKLARLNIERIQEILSLTSIGREKELYQWLINVNWMNDLTEYECRECGSKILMQGYSRSIDLYTWRCRKKACRVRYSIRTYSNQIFITHRRIPIRMLVNYIFTNWLHIHNGFETKITQGFCDETMRNLRRDMRTQIKWVRDIEDYRFGDNGIVEIDELVLKRWLKPDNIIQIKQGRDAYVKSPTRILKYLWILGMTERGTETYDKIHVHFDIMRARPSYNNKLDTGRNRREVDRIITPKLINGAIVMSDQHSMYQKLKPRLAEAGLQIEHNTINKRKEKYIVTRKGAPNLKIYTQGIENKWRLFRKIYRKLSRVTHGDLEDVLHEIAWRVEITMTCIMKLLI